MDVLLTLPEGMTQLPSGKTRWRVSVNGRRLTGTADDVGAARVARSQASLAGGGSSDVPIVAVLLSAYRADLDLSSSTLATMDLAASKLPEGLLARRIDKVTPAVADVVWRQLETDGVSRHVQAKAKHVLSKAWQMAMRLD